MTFRAVDAVPPESSAGHRPGRDCPCAPQAMRDLATGQISVWRHRTPPHAAQSLRGDALADALDRHDHEDADTHEHRAGHPGRPSSTGVPERSHEEDPGIPTREQHPYNPSPSTARTRHGLGEVVTEDPR